jgi:hypothetical protein
VEKLIVGLRRLRRNRARYSFEAAGVDFVDFTSKLVKDFGDENLAVVQLFSIEELMLQSGYDLTSRLVGWGMEDELMAKTVVRNIHSATFAVPEFRVRRLGKDHCGGVGATRGLTSRLTMHTAVHRGHSKHHEVTFPLPNNPHRNGELVYVRIECGDGIETARIETQEGKVVTLLCETPNASVEFAGMSVKCVYQNTPCIEVTEDHLRTCHPLAIMNEDGWEGVPVLVASRSKGPETCHESEVPEFKVTYIYRSVMDRLNKQASVVLKTAVGDVDSGSGFEFAFAYVVPMDACLTSVVLYLDSGYSSRIVRYEAYVSPSKGSEFVSFMGGTNEHCRGNRILLIDDATIPACVTKGSELIVRGKAAWAEPPEDLVRGSARLELHFKY